MLVESLSGKLVRASVHSRKGALRKEQGIIRHGEGVKENDTPCRETRYSWDLEYVYRTGVWTDRGRVFARGARGRKGICDDDMLCSAWVDADCPSEDLLQRFHGVSGTCDVGCRRLLLVIVVYVHAETGERGTISDALRK
jgi:hypothetical protein